MKTSPVLAAQQWVKVYNRCHTIGSPMVVFSAVCFAWLKYRTNNNLYLAAAASCMSIVPYTILILKSSEKIIFSVANVKKTDSAPLRDLESALKRWEIVNAVRVLFPLAGGVLVVASKML